MDLSGFPPMKLIEFHTGNNLYATACVMIVLSVCTKLFYNF